MLQITINLVTLISLQYISLCEKHWYCGHDW